MKRNRILYGILLFALAVISYFVVTAVQHGDDGVSAPIAASDAGKQAEIAETMPAALRAYGRPSIAEVEALTEAEVAALPTLCREETELSRKEGALWALALRADPRSFPLLQEVLLEKRGNVKLPQKDELVLVGSILALGLVAEASDDAIRMLEAGTDAEYWRERRDWKSAEFGDYSANVFVAHSIHALGVSGRDDAMAAVEKLKTRSDGYVQRHAGDMAEAAYYFDMRKDRGIAHLKSYLAQKAVCASEYLVQYQDWTKTPNGQRWSLWAHTRMRGPRAKE